MKIWIYSTAREFHHDEIIDNIMMLERKRARIRTPHYHENAMLNYLFLWILT